MSYLPEIVGDHPRPSALLPTFAYQFKISWEHGGAAAFNKLSPP